MIIEKKPPPSPLPQPQIVPSRGRPRGHGQLNCCLFLLALLLAAAGAIVWFLAASGLVTLPIISSWVYKAPTPIHDVVASAPLDVYLSEVFNDLLTDRLQAGGGVLIDRSVEVSLPEGSITASFRDLIAEVEVPWFDFEKAQVAVGEDGLELFLPLINSENNNALILFLVPGAVDGLVSLQSSRISLGSLTTPTWFSDSLLTPLLRQGLNPLNELVGRYAAVEKVEVGEGEMTVVGELSVEVMEVN
jgi:hypothetical protein